MVGFDFNELENAVSGNDFETRPVDLDTFIHSDEYLNIPDMLLSDVQTQLIKATTQIYRRDTLHLLYGFEEGERVWTETFNEIIFQLGKGGGKDFSSIVACAYIVYKLLCLKNPAKYYGSTLPGDSIDIINVAINAQQANTVFFQRFKRLINLSPWFRGKYSDSKHGQIDFDKNVTVYSGHSERESFEGYNTFMVILDEISGFAVESTSGNENAKTADSIYKMYRASVTSRFDLGKLVLLSFPRFFGDYIQQRYESVIAERETVVMSHTLKLDPELPDGVEGNEFDIVWDHEIITRYNTPRVFALKRTSWESNPTKTPETYIKDFFDDYIDALSRYACMPPMAVDAFFKDKQKIEDAFAGTNGVDESGRFRDNFLSDETKRYFIHVDLARKHDHCAVAMAHVERWQQRNIGGKLTEPAPVIKVDCVRWWTPSVGHNVDFTDVREFIISLKQRGFDVALVTFDRWQSDDMILELKARGLKSEVLSVAKKHYTDMAMVVHESRLSGPDIALLRDELLRLKIMPNDKVDHPRSGSKDLADATCGAIFNADAHTPRNLNEVIEVRTASSLRREVNTEVTNERALDPSVIRAPSTQMPGTLAEFLKGMTTI